MRILVEEYQYEAALVRDVLYGIDALQNVEGLVSLSYVGYFYNPRLKDCVFILPKVLMDENNRVFGKYSPNSIINLDKSELDEQERKFLYEFAVWIYRAIDVYHRSHKDSDIVYHRQISQVGRGMRRRTNTLLDILLSLVQFNKDNQNYITFILKNIHSGFNKINWTRTISHEQAFVQDEIPIYLRVANKKRQINFDEELLIIFYSILNHIHEVYGFPVKIQVGFPLITGAKFDSYLKGRGVIRLRQIKYKYFSDKALELWNLCYAFFAHRTEITTAIELKEYLLVKNFYIVFEAIIDKLIGDEIPADDKDLIALKEQPDGKLVDHLYTYPGLIEADEEQRTYYIGDSKYYKLNTQLGDMSIAKQYTYARNIIQYNIDLWLDDSKPNPEVRLRDDVTEGYNVIPNFFISAAIQQGDYSYGHREVTPVGETMIKYQFKDRLFDRDTMLLSRYNVNFLFVVALYARNRQSEQDVWKDEVRKQFRNRIREVLEKEYQFYPMRSKGVDLNEYMNSHFRELIGKVFTPFVEKDIVSLAFQKTDDPKLVLQQEQLLDTLEKDFYIDKSYTLGKEPALPPPVAMKFGLQDTVLVGYYRDDETLAWIQKKKLYNTRIGRVRGSIQITPEMARAKYLLLYGDEGEFRYSIETSRGPIIWTKEDLLQKQYPNPHHDTYLVFKLKDEITEGELATMQFDKVALRRLVQEHRAMGTEYDKEPVAVTLSELVNCSKDIVGEKVQDEGFCIRCGKSIPVAGTFKYVQRFYCEDCYNEWARYKNINYGESVCHLCSKPSEPDDKRTALIPLCRECWEKVVIKWK